MRLDEAGARDPSFGSTGVLDITPPESRSLQIAVDRWGRVLVLRQATSAETKFLAGFEVVSRWNADGTLDTGFGQGGEAAIKLTGEEGGLDALAVDGHGRPLLAGRVAPPRTSSRAKQPVFAPLRFALVRLSASGQPDRSFGKRGRILTRFFDGARAGATDIAIRGQRAIVSGPVLSERLAPGRGFALARYKLGS